MSTASPGPMNPSHHPVWFSSTHRSTPSTAGLNPGGVLAAGQGVEQKDDVVLLGRNFAVNLVSEPDPGQGLTAAHLEWQQFVRKVEEPRLDQPGGVRSAHCHQDTAISAWSMSSLMSSMCSIPSGDSNQVGRDTGRGLLVG